eukprot:6175668-Pleurochrysis_carterae.AAC.1
MSFVEVSSDGREAPVLRGADLTRRRDEHSPASPRRREARGAVQALSTAACGWRKLRDGCDDVPCSVQ